MLDAAGKALAQMVTPPFRRVLFKSVGLAIAVLIVLSLALSRVVTWLLGIADPWLENTVGSTAHWWLTWGLTLAISLGIVAGAIFLMPAVTALIAGIFSDEIAEHVEREHYPLDPPGVALPVVRAALEGVKIALLSVVLYLCCVPLLLFAGLGAVVFFLVTAYLLGREYFELAAMRFYPPAEAKALRRLHRTTVFTAGCFIAAFVLIPIVNLATPLFGTAFMVHIHKRVAGGSRRELLEPTPVSRIR